MSYKGCKIFFFFVYLQFDGGIQQDERYSQTILERNLPDYKNNIQDLIQGKL